MLQRRAGMRACAYGAGLRIQARVRVCRVQERAAALVAAISKYRRALVVGAAILDVAFLWLVAKGVRTYDPFGWWQ